MSDTSGFKKAVPRHEYFRIGLSGPSSSGKTVSALRLANGFVRGTGKRVCLIDTENGRSLKYAKDFDFDHYDFQPPFSSKRYLEILLEAEKRGYGAIVIDQLSSEHEGPGGVLEQHEEFLKKRAGDDWKKREQLKFTAWIEPKAQRNRFIQMGVQRVNADLILCFRAKEKIELKKNDQGKIEPTNAGWTPIGGEEFPFEMFSVMVLPPKSAGKPDWTQQASTINSLDKGLIHLLHNIKQIDENLGAEMKRISSDGIGENKQNNVTTLSENAPHSQSITPTKPASSAITEHDRMANRVKSAIHAETSLGGLDALWNVDYKPEIDQLKEQKPDYYKRLSEQYQAKIKELEG